MSNDFDVLFKGPEEIRKDVVKEFAVDFVEEIQKLIDEQGFETLMKVLDK